MAQRFGRPVRRLITALLLAWTVFPSVLPGELLPLSQPDLSAMEEAARQRIEAVRSALDELSRRGAGPGPLSEAYGELGQHYLAHELMDASEVALRNAGELAPEDFRWPYLLGIVLQSRGELPEAAAAFRRVLELRPADLPSRIRLGHVLLELDRGEEARRAFDQALGTAPFAAAAHFGLGQVAALGGDQEAARSHFETVLELEPGASIVHYPLGQAYRKLGDLEKAREHLKQRGREEVRFPDPLGSRVAWLALGTALAVVEALASDAEDFSERDYLGFALSQLGDVEGAVEELEEALAVQAAEGAALDPGSEAAARHRLTRARLHYVVGGLLVRRRSDEAARAHFESALELAPELTDARIKLGSILAREGRWGEAAAVYSEVLERSPDNASALLKRAAARMSQGQAREAVGDLEHLLRLDPEHVEARLRLAKAAGELGDFDAAQRHYTAALELELKIGERALVHYHLGELARARGALEGAVAHYRAAAELDPQLADARFHLATTLGRLRRFDQAAQSYRELIELQPQHVGARLGEATALLLAGRHGEASSRLEAGLEAMPGSLELTHTLARLLATCAERSVRDGARAVELAQEVVAALPTLEHAETLAMAFAEAGRFEEAVALQQSLVRQAEEKGDRAAVPRLAENLARYERGEAAGS